MIPKNELQTKIYQALQGVGIKVYDEVQEGATMPLISIGDYILSSLEFKGRGFLFNWTINIYTEYEGKKPVNELVSKTISKLNELTCTDLNEEYSINYVLLDNANISRLEGFYVANLTIRIEIL